MKEKLLKNVYVIFTGKFFTKFKTILLLPLYTNILSSSEYGIVDLFMTYVVLLRPIVTFNVGEGVFRFLVDSRKKDKEKVKIISCGFYGILFRFIIFLFIFFIINLFFDIQYKFYLLLLLFVSFFSNFLLYIYKGNGNITGYTVGSFINGVSVVLFNLIFLLFFKWDIRGVLLANILGELLCILYLLFKDKTYKYIKLNKRDKVVNRKLLKYSFPLIFNSLIWWVIKVSDRTIITLFLGSSFNGIYSISCKISNILLQLYEVFHISWLESVSININKKNVSEFFSNTFNMVLKIFMSINIVIIVILPFAFNLLVSKEFYESYYYIPLLLISVLFNIVGSFLENIYLAKKMTKKVFNTALLVGILNIIINVLLIKDFGIYAAVISTILSFMVMGIYRYIDIQKYVSVKINFKELSLFIILGILSVIVYYCNIKIIQFIMMIVILIIIVLLNRNIIFKFLDIIKKRIVK